MILAHNPEDMIRQAVAAHGLNTTTLHIEKELPGNWHGDLHFKIAVEGNFYYIRFLNNERFGKSNSLDLHEDRLVEQMRYIAHLNAQGIPFMRHLEPQDGNAFVRLTCGDREWKCLLFEWVAGVHFDSITPTIAHRFGQMARRFHDASIGYQAPALAGTMHTLAYNDYLKQLQSHAASFPIPEDSRALLEEYLTLAEQHLSTAGRNEVRAELRVITSDLNVLNILWDEASETINGIVDFEHIGWSDRVQDLAWLMKWYSRTTGIHSHELSADCAMALLGGYGASELLTDEDLTRLPAFLWLSGCLNHNTYDKTMKLIEFGPQGDYTLHKHLTTYLGRGRKLVGLYNPTTT